jgi:hypothetical protein
MAPLRSVHQAEFGRAVDTLRGADPADAASDLTIPDYGKLEPLPPQPGTDGAAVGAFAEMQARPHVWVFGRAVAVRSAAAAAAAAAVLLLVVVVLALVGFNTAPADSCADVQCGKYGSCHSGDCVCQPGYSGAYGRCASATLFCDRLCCQRHVRRYPVHGRQLLHLPHAFGRCGVAHRRCHHRGPGLDRGRAPPR